MKATGLPPWKYTTQIQGIKTDQLKKQQQTIKVSQIKERQRKNPQSKGKEKSSERVPNKIKAVHYQILTSE